MNVGSVIIVGLLVLSAVIIGAVGMFLYAADPHRKD